LRFSRWSDDHDRRLWRPRRSDHHDRWRLGWPRRGHHDHARIRWWRRIVPRVLMNDTPGGEREERGQGLELKRDFHTIDLFRVSSSDTFHGCQRCGFRESQTNAISMKEQIALVSP